jgi:hypothetical protein
LFSVSFELPINIPFCFLKQKWLTPAILATQKAEIRRIATRGQPREIVQETLSHKNPTQKRAGGVAQGVGPEFKPQHHKKRCILYVNVTITQNK